MKRLQLFMVLLVTAIIAVHARNVSVADSSIGSERRVRPTFLKSSNLPNPAHLDCCGTSRSNET